MYLGGDLLLDFDAPSGLLLDVGGKEVLCFS